MQKFLCVFLIIFLLCGIVATPALAIRAPDQGDLIIDGIAPEVEEPEFPTQMFLKIIGVAILVCYCVFTLIYYLSSRKQKNFSLVDCVKSFIPISIVALLCFIMSYLNISLYDGRWLALLCVIALITAPIFLFVSSMIHTIRLFSVEQAEIKDYKAYIKKTLITITVYFVTNAVCIAFIILYAEIL